MDKPQILWVGRSYVNPHECVKSHTHPYYHMILVVDGALRFEIENNTFCITPGQYLLVPRNTKHAFLNEGTDATEYLEIKFSLLKSAFDSQIARRKIQTSANELVAGLFKQIVKEYASFDNRADNAAASYLLALLNILGESDRYQETSQFRYFAASDYTELSQKIIKYLEEHYHEDVSLDSLARAIDYNKSYLCVAFKKDTHLKIIDCLNTIRIRRAAELVVYSEYTLTQVAEACGFSSVSHFNRVFLKYVGITPGQCRRAYPADILTYSEEDTNTSQTENEFMYSVLAQKKITPEMIQKLDELEAK